MELPFFFATNFLSNAESLVIGSDENGILVLDRNKNLSYKFMVPRWTC